MCTVIFFEAAFYLFLSFYAVAGYIQLGTETIVHIWEYWVL